jgi:hypothetical protein
MVKPPACQVFFSSLFPGFWLQQGHQAKGLDVIAAIRRLLQTAPP